ncbi:MipA/OmpV family protein [Pseudoalteromonas luteoviolacea]|uniref:MipA/OmpV family protein n=1 Tax=Pseudoalteromonas luteoviolacea TaxID=43657 RepID=UPI001B398768|nr:MipA/OmpV family protein [Pseudoalteromonas luteoviolacea]MBQ4838121.1 MipA/OmpV family protein [Pseudoalteromonas luteoviolacea]
MYSNFKWLSSCLAVVSLGWLPTAYGTTAPSFWDGFTNKREAGGFLSLGFGASYGGGLLSNIATRPLININGNYYFENGLFIEVPGSDSKFEPDWAMGYNLYNTNEWEFDLIFSSAHSHMTYYGYFEGNYDDRDLTGYIGLRVTGALGQYQIQSILAPKADNSEYDGGAYASLWVARSWQIKNWNYYASIGFQYRNSNMLNYYYGVPYKSSRVAPYEASGGVNTLLKFGFTKPISESWVVDGSIGFTDYASSIDKSPYSIDALKYVSNRSKLGRNVNITLSYVF